MRRRVTGITAVLLGLAGAGRAQSSQQGLRFEVTSIRASLAPSEFVAQHGQPQHVLSAARVELQVESLTSLILEAYELEPYKLSGPQWMDTARFDVAAKPPEGAKAAQIPEMLRSLLAERFKLAVHHEQRTKSVYALVMGQGEPKLKPAAAEAAQFNPNRDGWIVFRRAMNDDGTLLAATSIRDGRARLESLKIDMKRLAWLLQDYIDDPVVDMTGLGGEYEIAMAVPQHTKAWGKMLTATGGSAQGDAAEPGAVSIFSSVEALGLKLEHRKGPVDVLVVDHVDRTPTEN